MGNCVHCICTECLNLQRKLNIQNSKNLTGDCIHYICKEWLDLSKNWMSSTAEIERGILYIICPKCRDLKKNWISRTPKIQREIVYIIYVRPARFAEKLKVQNSGNSIWNCVQYMYGTSGYAENWTSKTA